MSDHRPEFINTRQLRKRYGDVSHMWVERRKKDDPTFPKPVYFGTRRYWNVRALEVWERTAASRRS